MRIEYENELTTDKNELTINTNSETINNIKFNQEILEALKAIVLKNVNFEHNHTKAEMSLDAMYFLEKSGQYYKFKKLFPLV